MKNNSIRKLNIFLKAAIIGAIPAFLLTLVFWGFALVYIILLIISWGFNYLFLEED